MNTLVLDTETTGKLNWKLPSHDKSQPSMVSLAGILFDENTGTELAVLHDYIKGVNVPAEASAIHGITNEFLEKNGRPIEAVLQGFINVVNDCQLIIAFNMDFDAGILTKELYHHLNPSLINFLSKKKSCVMRATTPVCKLPGRYGNYKWPKLIEAYRHLFGKDFVGAHDALNDVRATKEIWIELRKRNLCP